LPAALLPARPRLRQPRRDDADAAPRRVRRGLVLGQPGLALEVNRGERAPVAFVDPGKEQPRGVLEVPAHGRRDAPVGRRRSGRRAVVAEPGLLAGACLILTTRVPRLDVRTRLPAIDVQAGAGDPACPLRRQEHDGVRDLFRAAKAAGGDVLGDELLHAFRVGFYAAGPG